MIQKPTTIGLVLDHLSIHPSIAMSITLQCSGKDSEQQFLQSNFFKVRFHVRLRQSKQGSNSFTNKFNNNNNNNNNSSSLSVLEQFKQSCAKLAKDIDTVAGDVVPQTSTSCNTSESAERAVKRSNRQRVKS